DLMQFITLLGGAIAPKLLVTALLVVWPGWLRTAEAQSWMSEEGGGVRHIVVTLNKSRAPCGSINRSPALWSERPTSWTRCRCRIACSTFRARRSAPPTSQYLIRA